MTNPWKWATGVQLRLVQMPSWVTSTSIGQWYPIPNSAPNSTPGSTAGLNLDLSAAITAGLIKSDRTPMTSGVYQVYGHPAWYDAAGVAGNFNGGAFRQRDASVMVHGGGGDGQYAGNEVYSISLLSNTPVWTTLNDPLNGLGYRRIFRRFGSGGWNFDGAPSWLNSTYYADRNVISTINDAALPANYDLTVGQVGFGVFPDPATGPVGGHSYDTLVHNEITDETLKMGAFQTWGSDSGKYSQVHRLNRATRRWESAYYPSLGPGSTFDGRVIADQDNAQPYRTVDPVNGYIYFQQWGHVYRRHPLTNVDTLVYSDVDQGSDPTHFGLSCVDTTTRRLVIIRREAGLPYPTKVIELDPSTVPATRYTFTPVSGTANANVLDCAAMPEYNYVSLGICYVPSWSGWSGVLFDKLDGNLYRLTRNTGSMTYTVDLATTTAASAGAGVINGWTKPPSWMVGGGNGGTATPDYPRYDIGKRMYYSRLLGGVVRMGPARENIWFLRTR